MRKFLLPVVTVGIGSHTDLPIFPVLFAIINGLAPFMVNLSRPRAMRRIVFSARGFLRPKIDLQGIDQSIHSAAVLYGFKLSPSPCVGFGKTIG